MGVEGKGEWKRSGVAQLAVKPVIGYSSCFSSCCMIYNGNMSFFKVGVYIRISWSKGVLGTVADKVGDKVVYNMKQQEECKSGVQYANSKNCNLQIQDDVAVSTISGFLRVDIFNAHCSVTVTNSSSQRSLSIL